MLVSVPSGRTAAALLPFSGATPLMTLAAQLAQELQHWQPFDLVTVGTLAVLEGILSVDNALVLAILVRDLPAERRRTALTYGIAGAFVFRFVALAFATHLMRLGVFKLIGGGYLLYLAMRHLFFLTREDAFQGRPRTAGSFWKTVALVELTDIAFSIDSITTAVAMSGKLLVVWLGGILGIVFLRLAAGLFVRLLEKVPRLEDLAYQLIFFIGAKLTLEGFDVAIAPRIFWLMMAVIVVLGSSLVLRDHRQRAERSRFFDRLQERLERGEIGVEEILSQETVPGEVLTDLQERGWLSVRDRAPETEADGSR